MAPPDAALAALVLQAAAAPAPAQLRSHVRPLPAVKQRQFEGCQGLCKHCRTAARLARQCPARAAASAGANCRNAAPSPPRRPARRLCCLCGTAIAPNPTNMCVNCIRTQVDITEGIQKQVRVTWAAALSLACRCTTRCTVLAGSWLCSLPVRAHPIDLPDPSCCCAGHGAVVQELRPLPAAAQALAQGGPG